RKISNIGIEDGGLDEIGHRSPGGFENGGQVSQSLLGLGLDPLRDGSRLRIDSCRSGAEDEAVGNDRLAVRPQGGGRVFSRDSLPVHVFLPASFGRRRSALNDTHPTSSRRIGPPKGPMSSW